MRIRKLLSAFFLLSVITGSATAQDIHFSQYNMSPMTLNPANIGGFEGTARISGIYRSQWTSIMSRDQFET
ncbi:MAG: hypothetical protein RLZ62_2373, partial [Bacteroidota bacterium]